MKHLILSMLLAFSFALPLRADDAKPAAGAVIQVTGKPRFSMDGGKSFSRLKEGDSIRAGAMIKTGKGKVSILLTDGSTVRLGESTEITLKSHDPELKGGGTIFSLARGIGRFLVHKISKGNHFQVETSNAVAAVKGTDWGIESDGKETKAMVFETKTGSSIEFGSLSDLQKTILKENEKGGYDGKSFTHEEFTKEEQEKKDQDFKDMLLGKIEKSEKAAPAPTPAAGAENTEEKKIDLAKLVSDELDHFNEQLAKDEKLEASARKEDREERRIIIDRLGYEALVSNRIDRPDAASVVKTVITERTAGPNAGKSGAIEATQFHAAIGDDWYKAMQMKITDADNQEANGYPLNWRTQQSFLAFNPLGDSLEIKYDFDVPRFLDYVPAGAGPPLKANAIEVPGNQGYTNLGQGVSIGILANGQLLNQIDYSATNPTEMGAQVLEAGAGSGLYPVALSDVNGDHYCTYCGDKVAMSPGTNSDGSLGYVYSAHGEGDYDMFTLNARLLDDLGRTYAYAGSNGIPNGISDFYGLKDAVSSDGIRINVDVNITSQFFGEGHEIDLVFLPGFIDGFEFLKYPSAYEYNNK